MGKPAQKRFIRKLDLEIFLSNIPVHPYPKANFEQYTISGTVAAAVLYLATYTCGDIVGKRVLDLGCGTGRLSLASAFLGAASVVGIDISKTAIRIAHESSVQTGFRAKTQWIQGDIAAVTGKFDTVVQNPPFGVQKRSADRKFLEKALEVGNAVYSLHNHPYTDKQLLSRLKSGAELLQIEPSPFILRFVDEHGGRVEAAYALLMVIPHMFNFHTKTKHEIAVDLYVIRRR